MEFIAVGIDVAKDHLDVAVRPSGDVWVVECTDGGLAELCKKLLALNPTIVAIEATGGFEQTAAAALAGAGLPLVVVNPAQVRAFAKALGQRAKTDPIDAAVIAHFAEATRPKIRPLPDEQTKELAAIVARRKQIVEMIKAEDLREKRATSPPIKRSINRIITALKQELSDVDDGLAKSVRASPVWRETEDLLRSVPGIGPVISRTLIATMPELGGLNRKEIASLAGLAPFTRQSGTWRGKSFIVGGRSIVRTALFMGASVATRYNPDLKLFYEKLLKAGKPKKVAIIAVARKLLTILNAIVRDKKAWQTA